MLDKESKALSASRQITRTATMAAILVGGKFAFASIPYNVEVVTTLTVVFGCVFGLLAVVASLIFCAADMILYSFSLDVVIAYFIYWPMLALLAAVIKKLGGKSLIPYLITALIMTVLFGFLTTFTYWLFFGVSFWVHYTAGFVFYAGQLLSTLAFMLEGFVPLTKALERIKRRAEG